MKNEIIDQIEEGKREFRSRYGSYPNLIRMGSNFLKKWAEWSELNIGYADFFQCCHLKLEYDKKNPNCLELERVKIKEIPVKKRSLFQYANSWSGKSTTASYAIHTMGSDVQANTMDVQDTTPMPVNATEEQAMEQVFATNPIPIPAIQ